MTMPGASLPPELRIAGYLHPIHPHVPTSLVSPAAFGRAVALADQFPAAVTSFFGFECPLGYDTASADFLFCSTAPEGHARVLAGLDPTVDFPGGLLRFETWRRVSAFCRDWIDPSSDLGQHLLNTWLEFDLARDPAALQRPSFFFGPMPPSPDAPPDDNAACVRAVLARVEPAALAGARGETLRRLQAALPSGAHIFQVGLMWSREAAATRLCVRGLLPDRIAPLLLTLDWPGDVVALDTLLGALQGSAQRLDLDVDVGAVLGPRIGIECYFGRDSETTRRLALACDLLVARGLVTRAEAAGLLAYSGLSHQDMAADRWPPALRAAAAAIDPDCRSCLLRWVHHLKIVVDAQGACGAKAYLAVEHHLLDDPLLRQAIRTARHAH